MITGRNHTDTRSYSRTICSSKESKASLLEGLGCIGRLSGKNLYFFSFCGSICLVGCDGCTMSNTSRYYEYSPTTNSANKDVVLKRNKIFFIAYISSCLTSYFSTYFLFSFFYNFHSWLKPLRLVSLSRHLQWASEVKIVMTVISEYCKRQGTVTHTGNIQQEEVEH